MCLCKHPRLMFHLNVTSVGEHALSTHDSMDGFLLHPLRSLTCPRLQGSPGAMLQAALAAEQDTTATWHRSDAYFYRSIAAVQQLWQVSPSCVFLSLACC